jgi:hypothetical protein
MKIVKTISILIISQTGFSQLKSVVIDSVSNEKIPYVNIWIQNKNFGTTSNFNGEFQLSCNNSDTIIFSAIGYERKKICSDSIPKIICLIPIIVELKEVLVLGYKEKLYLKIGEFKKSKIHNFFACGINPWIVARYFPNDTSYTKTKYLNKLRFLTKSHLDNSKFYVRLYKATEGGEPGDFLFNEPIMGIAKKGKHITELDLSDLNLKFPEHGLFIAIEWLIIEENKYEFNYSEDGSNKKNFGVSYDPQIGVIPAETSENSWIYVQGKWIEIIQNDSNSMKNYREKYNLMSIELELRN